MSLIVYSKKNCNQCDIVKEVLENNKIDYKEEKVGSLEHVRRLYEDQEGTDEQFDFISSFPVIVKLVNDQPIIFGYEEAMKQYYEPIIDKKNNNYTLFPIKPEYAHFYEIYKKERACYWQPEEIDFSKDDADLLKLNENEKYFIFYIIAFFAASDGLVLENLGINFSKEIQIQEILHAYAIQTGIEAIHSETYSILLDRYVKDETKKMEMFNAMKNIESIKNKSLWVKKWTDPSLPLSKRIVAFCCVEGIMFSGSFCSIYWLKERGLLPGLCFANELISRDEGMHTNLGVEVYKILRKKLSPDEIYEIIGGAVEHEIDFITNAIPCRLIGMNSDLMIEYIKYVSDRLITQLGYPKLYNAKCPFQFMEKISLSGKTNFFEKRVGEYSKAGVMVDSEEQCFKLDEEF